MKGMAWHYSHTLAKTLEELNAEISAGMEKAEFDPEDDHCVLTTIMDGANGIQFCSQRKWLSTLVLNRGNTH